MILYSLKFTFSELFLSNNVSFSLYKVKCVEKLILDNFML